MAILKQHCDGLAAVWHISCHLILMHIYYTVLVSHGLLCVCSHESETGFVILVENITLPMIL